MQIPVKSAVKEKPAAVSVLVHNAAIYRCSFPCAICLFPLLFYSLLIAPCMPSAHRNQEGIRSPGTAVIDSCKLSFCCWKSGPLEDLLVFLTTTNNIQWLGLEKWCSVKSTAPEENQSPILSTYVRWLRTASKSSSRGSNSSGFHKHWHSCPHRHIQF